jgi:hypothetical protein
MPLPTVSRKVSELAAHLGTQLVIRTNRKLLLTDAGSAFVAAGRHLLEDLDEAERVAASEYRTPRGDLLITASIMFGKLYVTPVVLAFLAAMRSPCAWCSSITSSISSKTMSTWRFESVLCPTVPGRRADWRDSLGDLREPRLSRDAGHTGHTGRSRGTRLHRLRRAADGAHVAVRARARCEDRSDKAALRVTDRLARDGLIGQATPIRTHPMGVFGSG